MGVRACERVCVGESVWKRVCGRGDCGWESVGQVGRGNVGESVEE